MPEIRKLTLNSKGAGYHNYQNQNSNDIFVGILLRVFTNQINSMKLKIQIKPIKFILSQN